MKRKLVMIAILAMGCVLSPIGANAQATRQDRGQTGSAQQGAGGESRSERMFVNKASSGGQLEVQLGNLAQQKASNQQVKDLGKTLVDHHSQANQELQQVAQSKQLQMSTAIAQKDQKRMDRLQNLSGNEFDRAFVDEVIKAHKKDIALFEKQIQQGTDQEIKAFAQKTLPILQQHLQQAEQVKASLSQGGATQQPGSTQGGAQGQTGGTGSQPRQPMGGQTSPGSR